MSHLEFGPEGRLRGDLDPELEDGHRAQLEHGARAVLESGRRLQTTLHHWRGTELSTQVVELVSHQAGVRARLETPERCDASPVDGGLLERVLGHIDDAIVVTEASPLDEPGPRIVYCNAAFTRMTGYTLDEVFGRSPRLLQGPGTEAEPLAAMRTALRTWQPTRVEVTNYRKDGSPFVAEIHLQPLADPSGWFTHWVGVQRDVTDRRSLELQRLQADRLQSMSLLAAGIAHDFNNLLVGLVGNLELAQTSLQDPDEVGLLLDEAEAAAEQARELTRQLMGFARDSDDALQVVAIEALVRETVHFAVRGSGVDVDFGTRAESAHDLRVEADPSHLRQVIANVVINAVEAMDGHGGLGVRVRRADPSQLPPDLDPHRPWVQIDVADSGPGLSGADADRIFQPYFTTKERGSGVGLPMSRMLVARYGGTMRAGPRPVGGLLMQVYLPATDAPLPPVASPRRRDTPLPQASPDLRVVWMDDDPLVLTVAQRMGARLGWDVVTCGSGEELLPLVERSRPDLVILDRTIRGGLGGLPTLRRMRERGDDVPVLLASGYSAESLDLDGLAPGRFLQIHKPFRIDELLVAARQLVTAVGDDEA